MKTSSTNTLNVSDIFELWSNYRGMILACTFISLILFSALAVLIPKRYKSYFVLAINSNYFQNPLTRDLTPDIYDSAEMRSQRESLIRQALSPVFLDFIGEKYGIYQSDSKNILQKVLAAAGLDRQDRGPANKMRSTSEKRQELMSRISVLNQNSNTFRVSFIYSSPDTAFGVTQDIYSQMSHGLNELRKNNLFALRNALRRRLDVVASSLPAVLESEPGDPARPLGAPGIQTGAGELAEVRRQLRVMTVRYTEDHPMVKELRDRERALSAMGAVETLPASLQVPRDATVEMYKDLNRKLNYLNISLESDQTGDIAALENPVYPIKPLWPPQGLFVVWGLAAGLIGGFFLAALREYVKRAALQASDLSTELGVPFIGKLPVVPWPSQKLQGSN